MRSSSWTPILLALASLVSVSHGAGNTTCISPSLDWYTHAVGETPCTTYQRLRQICNSEYEVGAFRPDTPGDSCDDQVAACCCNSISFALSMLCMNCQQQTSANINGIDAGVGAYQLYMESDSNNQICSPVTNRTLPVNIQQAVCNTGIKLDNFLYDLFWTNGAWFYSFTRETAETDQATANNNTFTHCANQVSSSASPTQSQSQSQSSSGTTTNPPTSSSSATSATGSAHAASSPTGAIVGGVVGGVIALLAIAALVFFLKRRKPHIRVRQRSMSIVSLTERDPPSAPPTANTANTEPFLLSTPNTDAAHGHTHMSQKPSTTPFVISYASAHPSAPPGSASGSGAGSAVDSGYAGGSGHEPPSTHASAPSDTVPLNPAPPDHPPPAFTHSRSEKSRAMRHREISPLLRHENAARHEDGARHVDGARHEDGARYEDGGRYEEGLRHEDGGPVVELVRSPSGRLPPAYDQVRRSRPGFL
ncbi:hypothetical protein B0H21DRAFT_144909 [Amylocystis lapponica]|nr:hypothetical protein B0H21DRAFT_144909 [Amylocystis lapponica]